MLQTTRGTIFNVIFENEKTGEISGEFVKYINDYDYKNHIEYMQSRGFHIKSASRIHADDLKIEVLSEDEISVVSKDKKDAKELIYNILNISNTDEVKYFSKEICSIIKLRKDNYEYELNWCGTIAKYDEFDMTNSADMKDERTSITYQYGGRITTIIKLESCSLPNIEGIIYYLKDNRSDEFEQGEDYYRNMQKEFESKLESMNTYIRKNKEARCNDYEFNIDLVCDIFIEIDDISKCEELGNLINTIVGYCKSLEKEYSYAKEFALPF